MKNSRKISKNALSNILNIEDLEEPADTRSQMLTSQVVVEADVIDIIRDIFDGTPVVTNDEKISRILSVRAEIRQNWGQARDAFLAIGRALLDLETVLSKAEYMRLRSGSERLFPFSDATATQLRHIAEAVDTGKIPLELCPGSYGTAYQITLLDENQLNIARERGLIRPDVTRREILQLRKEIQKPYHIDGKLDSKTINSELKKLERQEKKLENELTKVRQRMKEITHIMG
ncbi:hypothetical protein JK168_12275 [Acetobacter thailandicus]|nr:hypothetical protein [Acetobacter thailandicus]